MDKKTKTMCVEVLSAIVDLCDDGRRIIFESDGGSTVTVLIDDYLVGLDGHKHVGLPGDGFERLVEKLHGVLVADVGWMPERSK